MQTDHNQTLFERARQVIPGGVNSPVRAFRAVGGTPRFVQRARVGDAAHSNHESHRRKTQRRARCIERLELETVLIRLEQQLQRLATERFGQAHRLQFGFVLGLQGGLLLLALHSGKRRLELVFGRALVAATALAAEVDRRAMQRNRQRGLLRGICARAEVLAGQVGKAELVSWRAFPEEIQIDVRRQCVRGLRQFTGRWLGKLQQHIARLDLGALGARQLDLIGLALLGQNGACADLAAFFKQQLHGYVWIAALA